MIKEIYLNQLNAIFIIIFLSLLFLIIGILYSKKYKGIENYILANRSVGTLSLTTSLVASALGTWILFGPASAATWGGIGAVIGYALGTAFPFFILIFLSKKIRNFYPNCRTLIEIVRLKYGKSLYKLILILSVLYMTVFLIAEVTAVSVLINFISDTDLWITALIIISCSLTYTLYGGLRASLFTDNIQFIVIIILLGISFSYLIVFNQEIFNFSFIKEKKPNLLSLNYLPNFTSALTFFIAVAATNLFHQGNWQRIYAAKNYQVLKKSLIISFLIVIPIVFLMGFSGLISVSTNSEVIPDLAFFELLFKDQFEIVAIVIIVLAISLTVSSVDTLINAISSLIIVDGNRVFKTRDSLYLSKIIVIILCLITFFIASKGFSILYLFLLADLLCCSAVLTIFYGFYNKSFSVKTAFISILIGICSGLLFFPSPDFSKSILIGTIISIDFFPAYMSQSLLFLSFIFATFAPIIAWKIR